MFVIHGLAASQMPESPRDAHALTSLQLHLRGCHLTWRQHITSLTQCSAMPRCSISYSSHPCSRSALWMIACLHKMQSWLGTHLLLLLAWLLQAHHGLKNAALNRQKLQHSCSRSSLAID